MRTGNSWHDVDAIFTAGIACHAIVAAEDSGLFDILRHRELAPADLTTLRERDHERAAGVLRALLRAAIVEPLRSQPARYTLTSLGREVAKNTAVFKLWFQGYAGLLGQPGRLGEDEWASQRSRINGRTVAEASAAIGVEHVDADLFRVMEKLGPRSAICDLGCGTGSRLGQLCDAFGVDGVGLDINADAVAAAEEHLRARPERNIVVECQDVSALSGRWPSVDIVIQTFMTHHLVPDRRCAAVLGSYRETFPNARYLVVLDTVTPPGAPQPQLFTAGFDYIHRLQGLVPRGLADAHRMFQEAGLKVADEVALAVPHSYLWTLEWHARQ